ncbi:succinate dehydrogenase assembly factor 2 [Candidatus Paracaedibacter symbiosus]|uniref:FAD assembly factor SdhE n=1 Tax=Candidatus Paracaedibacter symbiosus TaxID=244582 RepID=UPI0005099821|nr:succinate dehydrogenase assembly factor 2 [Candidatus Paracaedibacter symbiosus]
MINIRLKKKLRFQAWHRGTKENDLLLGRYADDRLPKLSDIQVMLFLDFMNESDLDIFGWIVHKIAPPLIFKELINDIIQYHE